MHSKQVMKVTFLPALRQATALSLRLQQQPADHESGLPTPCSTDLGCEVSIVSPKDALHVCAVQMEWSTTPHQYHSKLICCGSHTLQQLASSAGMQTLSADPT